MRIVPRNIAPKIAFMQARLAPWLAHAEEIGTSNEAVAALAELLDNARAALAAQLAAQSAARAATLGCDLAMRDLTQAGRNVIQQIRTKASADGTDVYSLALIPAPAAPSPVAAPGTPSQFAVQLEQTGALRLSWKCKNPPNAKGTLYQIHRRIGQGAFVEVGIVGKKNFVDNTLPKGSTNLTYQIRAVRSTRTGDAAQFNVAFGGTGARRSVVFHASRAAA